MIADAARRSARNQPGAQVPAASWPVAVAARWARRVASAGWAAAFALGALTFLQLLLVSVVVAAADITFRAASGVAA